MKNTLFIFPQSHRGWLPCQDASPMPRKAKKDKARPHNLLSVLLIFPRLGVGMSGNYIVYIVPRICFLRFQNKLCVTSQKSDLVSQCFSTFSFKRMHLNNNEEERMMARSEI